MEWIIHAKICLKYYVKATVVVSTEFPVKEVEIERKLSLLILVNLGYVL
jgi:hypothetical protein